MSRRRVATKREIIPDPVYKDLVFAKFINKMTIQGKKATAQKMFYGALSFNQPLNDWNTSNVTNSTFIANLTAHFFAEL